MKVIGFSGSPRKDGNTAVLINKVFEELNKSSIETELVQLSNKPIHGCIACGKCFIAKNKRCAVTGDIVNECIEKMIEADGIILGSPVYFANLTPEIKALIDRAGFVAKANNDMFKQKVGAALTVARRAGAIHVFDSLNHFFLINQMIIPGSSYWNIGYGREAGEVANDNEAMNIMKVLGQNMAWLLKKLHT